MRRTHTDLDSAAKSTIEYFSTEDGARELPHPWMRKTVFHHLRPPAPPGYRWVIGRLAKVQEITRPDNIWPEVWQVSRKQKRTSIEKWKADK